MQNKINNNLYSNQVGVLYKIFKSQLPSSIILTGQDIDIISNIAYNFAKLAVTNEQFENYNDFRESLYNSNNHDSHYILKIEPIFLNDKQRFKKKIYREDIKHINQFFSTKDEINQKRICIINLIDDFSLDAANSILKIIEEPNKNNHFIIVNQHKERCLQTIVSRSNRIYFGKLNYTDFLNFYKDSENEEYLNYLYQITNGSSYLSKKFIEYNFYEINDHFKVLLMNRNKIKANTASHYIDYLHNFKNIEQVIPVFLNYLQLLVSDEIKKHCCKNENELVMRLMNVYTLIESFNKKHMTLSLDFENIVISLFHRLKYE